MDKSRFPQKSNTTYNGNIPKEIYDRYVRAANIFLEELLRLHFDTDCKAVGARVVKQRGEPGNVRITPEYEYDVKAQANVIPMKRAA